MQRELTQEERDLAGLDDTPKVAAEFENWTRRQIREALAAEGFTLNGLERAAGLSTGSVNQALIKRYPKVDRVIAAVLKRHLHEIWPLRYLPGGHSIQSSKKYTNLAMAAAVRRMHEQMARKVHLPPGVPLIRKFEVR